jgi:hypothetical protein
MERCPRCDSPNRRGRRRCARCGLGLERVRHVSVEQLKENRDVDGLIKALRYKDIEIRHEATVALGEILNLPLSHEYLLSQYYTTVYSQNTIENRQRKMRAIFYACIATYIVFTFFLIIRYGVDLIALPRNYLIEFDYGRLLTSVLLVVGGPIILFIAVLLWNKNQQRKQARLFEEIKEKEGDLFKEITGDIDELLEEEG